MNDDVLATIEASAPRRVMGTLMLGATGCILVYMAFAAPPSPAWLLFLLVVGAGALWLAVRMWQATTHRIELTAQELRCSDGQVIARVEEIEAIDRGFFAFKPSNGFLIRTRAAGTRCWLPGLWWRAGRRIGVGGVTPGQQGKVMSDILAAMLAQRSQ